MLREVIATGATVEKAKEKACQELGVETYDDRIDFEIIEMQSKKVLGLFGGHPAKVKVTLKQSAAQAAEDFIRNIIDNMELSGITLSTKDEDNVITIDIEGDDVGFIIGRRGETMDALQYLTCLAANRVDPAYKRVVINTGDYREKREKTLESLGRRLAIKAAKTGKKSVLEPMNPYERRIIHSAIAEIEGVSSRSEGEEPYRRVVISSNNRPQHRRRNDRDGGNRSDRRGGGRPDRRGGRRNDRRDRRSDAPPQRMSMDSMKTSFERDYKRPKEDDDINTGLYGKIEF